MEWLIPAVIATLISSVVLFVVYTYLYKQEHDYFLATWAVSWGFYSCRFVFLLFSLVIARHQAFVVSNQLCALWSAYFLLKGSFQFSKRDTPRWWLVVSIAGSIWILGANFASVPFMWLTLPIFSFLALVSIWTGKIFLRFGISHGLSAKVVGFSFIIWGLHKLDFPFLQPVVWFAPWGYLLGAILAMITSIGIILVYFQKTRNDLVQSEDRYRQSFEANQAIKLILDPDDGSIIDANQAACDFYGYSRTEMTTKKILDFNALPPEEVKAKMAAVKEGNPARFLFPHRLASGVIRDVEVFSGPIQFQGRILLNSIVFDVTDRKRAEEKLRSQTEELQMILDTMPATIWFKDTDNNFLRVNKATCEIMGMTASQIEGRHAREVFPEWLAEKYYQDDLEVINSGVPKMGIKEQLANAAGELRWVNTDKIPWYDSQGKLAGVLAFAVDITDQIQATKALQESEEKFRSLFNNAEVGMFRTRVDGSEILDFNEKYLEIFGYSRDEMLKLPASIYWADPHEREEMIARLKADGSVKNFECGMLNRQGEVRRCLTSLRLFSDQGILEGSIIDITDRKKAEAELRASEERNRRILHSAMDGFWRVDAQRRIIEVNETYCRMSGYSQEEILTMCVEDFEAGDTPEGIAGRAVRIMKTGSDRFVSKHRRKDGSLFDIEVRIWYETGKDSGEFAVFLRDISEQRRIEAKLRQAQKMEAIGTLAGGIAHDFNNILTPIIGFSEVLKEDIPDNSPEQEYISEIHQASLRARDLVNQILMFSRQNEQELRPIKVQPVIKESLKLIRSSIPKTIDIQTAIDPDCGMVVADPTQIHQIIMNLATNAYHAMWGSGGVLKVILKQIAIESRVMGLSGLNPGNYAMIKVIDTGVGIKKEIMSKIFDPYFSTKEKSKGTGLGLSVVQGIVKNFKGDIHVYSEPGRGTEVIIYLPVIKKTLKPETTDTLSPVPTGSERILLIDDELSIVRMEHRLLERLGYKVTSLTSGVAALESFRTNPRDFDLILTDMTMPEITGLKLVREMRLIRDDIPAIICTGFSDQINETTFKEAGIQGYIAKPVMRRQIAQIIRDVLDNPR